jgi:hypothetical protein
LQGEFAFVPGVAPASDAAPDPNALGEIAFWNSIQGSNRADEYRAYLRQYPKGRFVALAQARITANASPATGMSAPAELYPGVAEAKSDLAPAAQATPSAAHPEMLPHPGDTWRYRVQDQFRLGDLFVTAKVDAVTAQGVSETWTTTSDAQVRTAFVSQAPGFNVLPGWTLTPPEFSPYLQASGLLQSGRQIGEQKRLVDQTMVALHATIEGDEEIAVAAGRFRTTKVILRGQSAARSRGAAKAGPVLTEQTVWYAPAVKRIVKQTVFTRVSGTLTEATSFELMEFKLN